MHLACKLAYNLTLQFTPRSLAAHMAQLWRSTFVKEYFCEGVQCFFLSFCFVYRSLPTRPFWLIHFRVPPEWYSKEDSSAWLLLPLSLQAFLSQLPCWWHIMFQGMSDTPSSFHLPVKLFCCTPLSHMFS